MWVQGNQVFGALGVPLLFPFPLPPSYSRDLKQSGKQRQRRFRLKNEFLPLIRISKMAARVYRLIRRHTSTSA